MSIFDIQFTTSMVLAVVIVSFCLGFIACFILFMFERWYHPNADMSINNNKRRASDMMGVGRYDNAP